MPSDLHWVGTWTTAPAPAEGVVFSNHTLRMNLRASIGGDTLRVHLSNAHGGRKLLIGAARIGLRDAGPCIVPGSDRQLTFGGAEAATIAAGSLLISDPVSFPFPPLADRYALLEEALQFLPLYWGKGAPSVEGRVLRVPEAMCYPRPLQDHVPILVGGNGERRTLPLAARYADACNIIGEADVVARKVGALRSHCEGAGRAPSSVEVTQLSTTLVGKDAPELAALVERLRPRRSSAERYAARVNAGTVDDQVGRFRALAQAGVQAAIVSFPDLVDADPIQRFREVIDAFGH